MAIILTAACLTVSTCFPTNVVYADAAERVDSVQKNEDQSSDTATVEENEEIENEEDTSIDPESEVHAGPDAETSDADQQSGNAVEEQNDGNGEVDELNVDESDDGAVGEEKIFIKWKRNAKASGYLVQYSLKKSFKNAKTKTVKGNKTVSKKIGGLKKGKTYYVRMRCYKKVNGTTYYSAWSAAKKVKIKR